jgi:hypothetical protein
MPVPFRNEVILQAVETALEKTGALTPNETVADALNDAGADVRRAATELANLLFNSKDSVRLQVIKEVLAFHGVNLRTQETGPSQPVININVIGEDVNLHGLYAPERKF